MFKIHVRKREDGRWEGRIVVGHKENGELIFQYVLAPTQKALLDKLHQNIEIFRDVELCDDSRMTLAQWLDRWLDDYAAPRLRESTMSGYRMYAEQYIKPRLGSKKVVSITTTDIQRLYTKLKKGGRVHEHPEHGHQLSANTVRRIHTMLHRAMADAVRARIIPRNPADGVTLPKADTTSKRVLTDKELDDFMETIQADPLWYDFFYAELTTGLRRGEICGLQWRDFDGETGTLQISRTLHRMPGGGLGVGETKTGTGKRKILLPQSTANILRERKKSAHSEWIFSDPLHPEHPISPEAAYRRLKALLKQAGLPDIPFHALRHTFSSHALASGVDPKTLSGILGHTDASFTLNTYTHVTTDMQKQASVIVGNFMEDIFGKDLKPWQNGENAAKEAST
ncbi:MAG: site-specific integrase [Oscillospiraceae bacterium]|nr:site-specific integrase [Oscillospiraceae bacterium]